MPKQSDIRVQIPSCTAAHFWEVVYERPEATERYHTSFNASTSTSVTPWASCQRTVNFTMPLKLPDFLKRMVGLDSVAVTEVQRVVWHGGGSFTVTSDTNITNMLGAGRFTTALQLTVTEQLQKPEFTMTSPRLGAEDAAAPPSSPSSAGAGETVPRFQCGSGDCGAAPLQLLYSVRCAAVSIPWPMSATIENVMSEKALVSMQNFLDFCTQLLEEGQAVASAAAAFTAAASTLGGATVTTVTEGAPEAATTAPLVTSANPCSSHLAAAALLGSAGDRASEGGTTSPFSAIAAGGPRVAGGSAVTAPSASRTALRHRWPSITCSQDVGMAGVGIGVTVTGMDPFKLHRADTTAGVGGDVFWDAPENFASVGSGSGVSSSAASPRQLLLPSNSLQHLSGDCGTATTVAGGVPTAAAAAAAAASANAAATETHQVAVAVDRLVTAIATLDGKVEKLLLLQEDQQQQLRHILETQQRQQQQERDPPPYLLDQSTGPLHGRSSRGGDATDARSDVRWLFRVSLAVLLATLLIVGYWVVHPYATGFRPHSSSGSGSSGSGGGGGGSSSSTGHRLFVTAVRLNSTNESLGHRGDGLGPVGGNGGGAVIEPARLALQVPGHVGEKSRSGARKGELRGKGHGGESTGNQRQRRRRRQRQRQREQLQIDIAR